jgi:hypothetical protein
MAAWAVRAARGARTHLTSGRRGAAQLVPGEPVQVKQLAAARPGATTAVANNSSNPAGRRAAAALRVVLADRFGNAVGGPPTDGRLLVMALREADEGEGSDGPGGPGGPGGIRPLDVQFLFINDAARAAKVRPRIGGGVGAAGLDFPPDFCWISDSTGYRLSLLPNRVHGQRRL